MPFSENCSFKPRCVEKLLNLKCNCANTVQKGAKRLLQRCKYLCRLHYVWTKGLSAKFTYCRLKSLSLSLFAQIPCRLSQVNFIYRTQYHKSQICLKGIYSLYTAYHSLSLEPDKEKLLQNTH